MVPAHQESGLGQCGGGSAGLFSWSVLVPALLVLRVAEELDDELQLASKSVLHISAAQAHGKYCRSVLALRMLHSPDGQGHLIRCLNGG
ncbi:MAG TPA: hypothetical protein DIW43_00065, partial [Spongiibacteraceae bacterium]|nr:hypothetical protein [Spongiibacteraceae bacterium]